MLCETVQRGGVCRKSRDAGTESAGGRWAGAGRGRGCVGPCRQNRWDGLGTEGGSGRQSGAERQSVCGWPNRTPHSRCAGHPAQLHGPHHYFTLLMLCSQQPFPKQKNCGITAWGGCQGSARAVHPFKQTITASFQSSLECTERLCSQCGAGGLRIVMEQSLQKCFP